MSRTVKVEVSDNIRRLMIPCDWSVDDFSLFLEDLEQYCFDQDVFPEICISSESLTLSLSVFMYKGGEMIPAGEADLYENNAFRDEYYVFEGFDLFVNNEFADAATSEAVLQNAIETLFDHFAM